MPLIDYHVSESFCDVTERRLPRAEIVSEDTPTDTEKHLWEIVEGIAILIIDAANPRLEADTLAFMAGFYARMGKSGRELGARYGLTRAAWSKRCKAMQRRLNLEPSIFMKSKQACQSYALTNGKLKTKWAS